MWSLSLVISEWFLSGRGQCHVSNFYIVDLENFAAASRRYTGDTHNSTVSGLFMTPETMGAESVASWLSAHCTLSITHCLRLNLQLYTINLVRICRISSFCTVAWQLARFWLTRRIARSLGASWASCLTFCFRAVCFFIIVSFGAVVSALWAFLSSRHSSALYCFCCIVSVLINKIFIHSFIHVHIKNNQ